MKFPSLKSQQGKFCDISLSDDCVEETKNVWITDGVIKSRKGIDFSEEKTVYSVFSNSFLDGLVFTDKTVQLGEERKRIAYAVFRGLDMDELFIVFIGNNGEMHLTEEVYFLRLDDTAFYRPVGINFFNSSDENGQEKLYAMILTSSYRLGNMSYETRIFVYDSEDNCWNVATDQNPYYPIVLMNGQGNNYYTAIKNSEMGQFTPYYPESANLFTGWCRSYFTSDGYSSNFKTPCEQFALDQEVKVTYEDITGEVTWTIPANTNELNITILDEPLKILCFREYGSISFVTAQGQSFPLPRYYECSNNLMITACDRNSVSKYNNIVSCEDSVIMNSRMLLCDNYLSDNVIYYMDLRKSMYAPKTACVSLGDAGTPVTAVKKIGNNIFAFKEDEIYSIDINYGKQAKYTIFPMKLNETLRYSDTLTATCINNALGCQLPKTFSKKGNVAFWLNRDNCIYSIDINGKSGMFLDLRQKFQSIDDIWYDGIRGCVAGNYYVLCVGNVMFLTDIDTKHTFTWELPQNVTIFDVCDIYGDIAVGVGKTNDRYVYLSRFSQDCDTVAELIDDGDEITFLKAKHNIQSKLKSKKFDLGFSCAAKIFESVIMNVISGKGFTVTFDGKNKRFVSATGTDFGQVKLLPHLSRGTNIQFTVESRGPMEFGDIRINYRTADNLTRRI